MMIHPTSSSAHALSFVCFETGCTQALACCSDALKLHIALGRYRTCGGDVRYLQESCLENLLQMLLAECAEKGESAAMVKKCVLNLLQSAVLGDVPREEPDQNMFDLLDVAEAVYHAGPSTLHKDVFAQCSVIVHIARLVWVLTPLPGMTQIQHRNQQRDKLH